MSNSILLAPGPVQLHPDVQRILSMPMIHHRTPEFDLILSRVLKNLKYLFQTEQPVFLQSSTGSGGMESLLINVLSPKDHVLCLVGGKFGERWAEMAETFGAHVHRLNTPWGAPFSTKEVETYLLQHPEIQIVLAQACETSTATKNDIETLGALVSKTNALLLVDGITAVGAYPIPMDQWEIDGLVAGSQKGVMLPTGLSFVSFSKKAWEKIKTSKCPKFYFDIQKEFNANQKGETLFSSNVPLIRALDFVLNDLAKKSYEKHFSEIQRRADYTAIMGKMLHLELYSKNPSPSVTAFALPPTINGVEFRNHLEKKYNLTVMGGQDILKGKIIRLGHMGYITNTDLHECTIRIAQGLIDFGQSLDLDYITNSSTRWLTDHI